MRIFIGSKVILFFGSPAKENRLWFQLYMIQRDTLPVCIGIDTKFQNWNWFSVSATKMWQLFFVVDICLLPKFSWPSNLPPSLNRFAYLLIFHSIIIGQQLIRHNSLCQCCVVRLCSFIPSSSIRDKITQFLPFGTGTRT